jgi:hypothetical protein
VELARWALDISESKAQYTELALPVGPHAVGFAVPRLLFVGGLGARSSFPGSSIQQPWYSPHRFAWVRRLTGTPALITAEGNILPDSWSILKHSGFTINASTQAEFDAVLGPAVRQFAYFHIFTGAPQYYRTVQSCGPVLMSLFDCLEYTLQIKKGMIRMMNLTATGAEIAAHTIRGQFQKVSDVLAKHPYLGDGSGGDSFGGADLAWCALAGWVVHPQNFHRGLVRLPDLRTFPHEVQELQKQMKNTPAGMHCLMCYREHRLVAR